MLKLVSYIDYNANYAYSPPHSEAVINTEEIVSVIQLRKEDTRVAFYDLVRIHFKDGTTMDVIGFPRDFVEIESGG